jgi:hypothetical protein
LSYRLVSVIHSFFDVQDVSHPHHLPRCAVMAVGDVAVVGGGALVLVGSRFRSVTIVYFICKLNVSQVRKNRVKTYRKGGVRVGMVLVSFCKRSLFCLKSKC